MFDFIKFGLDDKNQNMIENGRVYIILHIIKIYTAYMVKNTIGYIIYG